MAVRREANETVHRARASAQRQPSGKILISAGGILTALLSASCCVVPFALFLTGVSGAWIGGLTALKPYQPLFIGLTVAFLGGGYYAVYRKPKAADCVEGSFCARPLSDRIAKIGLWVATVLVVVALGFPYAVRHFLDT
jgi:mercuric ion transport protein